MKFSGMSTYRSEGLGVNKTDNMVRVTVFATRNEWRRMLSAVQNIERRKTVRRKPPVQQRKVDICNDLRRRGLCLPGLKRRIRQCVVCPEVCKRSPVA